MSETTTRGVRVSATATFVPEHSSAHREAFIFAYEATISNEGDEPVTILSRRWMITDSQGQVEEVFCSGSDERATEPVTLVPGESHVCQSFCPLRTNVGFVQGAYQIVAASGERFEAAISPVTLAVPNALQ